MSCCGLLFNNTRKKFEKQGKGLVWKFSNGSMVLSESYMGAISQLEKVNSRDFWASETNDGTWDVQLTDHVVVSGIQAKTVIEAVRIARWKAHLDKSFKKIDDYRSNVF